MKNPKTTLAAIAAIIPTVLQIVGIEIPTEVAKSVETIGIFFLGLFSKDNNK